MYLTSTSMLLKGLHECQMSVSVVVGRLMCISDVYLISCWKAYMFVTRMSQLLKGIPVCRMSQLLL